MFRKFIKKEGLTYFDWVRLNLLVFLKRVLFKDAVISYSLSGEDLIIQSLLKTIKKGFYIDLGCYHPFKASNTFSLYLKGWNGIVIDANNRMIKEFKSARKRDIVVNAAVSNIVEEVIYHEFKYSIINTISKDFVEKVAASNIGIKNQVKLTTTTLNNILDTYLPKDQSIDLLSIDIEGHDLNALLSIDLEKYRPKLIVVEIHDYRLDNIQESGIFKYLTANQYLLINLASINAYFMDKSAISDHE